MTEDHDIAIELEEGAEAEACQVLDSLGIGAEELTPVSNFYKLSLKGVEQQAVDRFLGVVCEKLGKVTSHRVTRRYSRAELDKAAWLSLRIETTHLDNPEPSYDTSGACPRCGAGATPTAPLRFARNQMGRRLLDQTAYAGLLIVHRDLVDRINEAGLTGVRFEPAVLGREPDLYRWARITSCLPPASPETPFLRTNLCKRCRRGGYRLRPEQPLGLRYDNPENLAQAEDFNTSWECVFNLGSQKQPQGGRRIIVISRKALELLGEVKAVELSPVAVG